MPSQSTTLTVAIVGAGPAGFYTAEALSALCPGAEISLIERLPTPYGLVRFGVAPDHQSTKKIQEAFDAIAGLPGVRFVGNVDIGRDVTLDELRGMYDAVVLSCGVPDDAPLGIPGEDLDGVYGAASFVGWYNGHPDHAGLAPRLDRPGVVVVGNGNVAIDIARILSKSAAELAHSDLPQYASERIAGLPPGDIHIVGRRGAVDAKFTTIELEELKELEQAVALAVAEQIPAGIDGSLSPRDKRVKLKNLDCLRTFAAADPDRHPRRIRFRFNARPVEILGTGRVEAVRFEETRVADGKVVGTGEMFDLPCGLVVSAIGYRARPLGELVVASGGSSFLNEDGWIGPALYVTGWLKRGPSGKIGTNRTDGEHIAARIAAEVSPQSRPGLPALMAALAARGGRALCFDDWRKIQAAERPHPDRPIRKITRIAEMLEALGK